ncbi:exopolyphosphatase / guanosine-5'-triphosphate,3'-diphosphate pyrophosphatase [Cyclobacterium lianum]|uniref:Exopolyphosphatase / guanosine-5'-triphosphate,3'-diphosphate pyrophosphatase n=1 Tax=Cyclobacterium lianum TaxID=388280 RepID=A0A1M7QF73_9BACT|nr:Ppx/GppA phosphatase family protein [Cyclobacterium lianum]SHN29535.1 exopolyphosphatase / guanosine-5'-triphosphate,3'-diphosphate pyrophosphatase [Cyclobacterium lianum]
MNLAAIDIGTNSIHMIIVKVISGNHFDILMQEKNMVKLGLGVFANNKLSDKAVEDGVATIKKYVQLADQYGVDDIIVSATSATREAKNGREFLDRLIHEAGVSPRLISGKEEAKLIFLAVKEAISIKKEKILVLDIGGGSTEAVLGDENQIHFGHSMKLGVLRLLDQFGHQGILTGEEQKSIQSHIRQAASKIMEKAMSIGFDRVVGTSGTIRSLAEACLEKKDNPSPESVNAEEVQLEDLIKLRDKLLNLSPEKRAEVPGISANRTDAIHLGAILLVELLQMAGVNSLTISDASLREGMIIHHIGKRELAVDEGNQGKTLKEKSCFLLASRYETELEAKKHVSGLALQLFDQLKHLHQAGEQERSMVYHAALIYDVGLFIQFQDFHKHSRYIIKHSQLRGFTNEEILLLGHLARYHRKKGPKKRHKKFKKLSAEQQQKVRLLAGILRIAIGLDKTKNQWVQNIYCLPKKEKLQIQVFSIENITLEIWEARRFSDTLSKYLKKEIEIVVG